MKQWIKSQTQHISHIKKRLVESLEIHLEQITKHGEGFGSRRISSVVPGAEVGIKKMQDQQAHNSCQQGD